VVIEGAGTPVATIRAYKIGYGASLIITIGAYILVSNHLLHRDLLVAAVSGLAVIQFVVQLLYFLHLGHEAKPRWKLMVFGFMLMVVVIVVAGSLWIMSNLNYRMTPAQQDQYLQSQNGL
jgi:cytochrome o ubiquinol oxidase operon protein cyoD